MVTAVIIVSAIREDTKEVDKSGLRNKLPKSRSFKAQKNNVLFYIFIVIKILSLFRERTTPNWDLCNYISLRYLQTVFVS